MDYDRALLRLCAAALTCAVLLRLGSAGALQPVARWMCGPDTASFFLYLQTGRAIRVRAEAPPEPTAADFPLPRKPAEAPERPDFDPAALEALPIRWRCSYRPDLEALLTAPLEWDLRKDGPKVLIVHTHTTESYTPLTPGAYEPSGEYRTLDPAHNMLAVGEVLAQLLEEAGIGVVHDRQFHDYPSFNTAYPTTRASTEALLEQYPSVELILDLHRDAADTPAGQLVTECDINGQTGAQLMMVVGTDECGLANPDWEKNLALALKLQVLLEQQTPGICRRLTLTDQRYNQHLGGHALLIEVGAAGNTLPEAELAVRELARAIIALSHGSSPRP